MAFRNSIDSSIVGFGSGSTISAAMDSPETNKEVAFINEIYDVVVKVSGFVVTKCMFKDQPCLIISHQMLYNHPPFGITSRCRISVTAYEYIVKVLMREVERGSLTESASEKMLYLCSKYSTDSRVYKFCPGLDPLEYEKSAEVIRFDAKSVHKMSEPFLHVESVRCLRWFELGKTSSLERRKASAVICPPCVRLRCDVDHWVRLVENERK